MPTYLDTVKQASDQLRAAQHATTRVAEEKAKAQWAERLTPLEDRVAKLIDELPASLLSEGISLESLRRLLAGKWRGNCHPGELGAALRKLGFVRRRSWSEGDGGFVARWFEQNAP